MENCQINKLPIFTQEIFYFELPNFNEWKEQINQIILVEDNKQIHNHNTAPEENCNVMAKRTAWNSHERYSSLNLICEEIEKNIKIFVDKEGYDIPNLKVIDCWLNWYKQNQYAQPHKHGNALSAV